MVAPFDPADARPQRLLCHRRGGSESPDTDGTVAGMTELLSRPHRQAADVGTTPPPSVWWRGVLAAVWSVAVGVATLLVVVLIAWGADSRAGAGATAAMRSALQIWLVAH